MSGKQLHYIAETTSTNDSLKLLKKKQKLENGFTVYTDFQTLGRGQMGNIWKSEKAKNLLFSIYIKPKNIPISEHFIVIEIVTVTLKKILDHYVSDISIKWPNDIYWNNKKLGGMLIENTFFVDKIATSIIGVGLNINQETFCKDLLNPVSLHNITTRKTNRLQLLTELQNAIVQQFDCFDKKSIHENYLNNLFRKNLYHKYRDSKSNETFEAKIQNVQHDGQLVLEMRNGSIKKFYFKEVEFLLS